MGFGPQTSSFWGLRRERRTEIDQLHPRSSKMKEQGHWEQPNVTMRMGYEALRGDKRKMWNLRAEFLLKICNYRRSERFFFWVIDKKKDLGRQEFL